MARAQQNLMFILSVLHPN